MRMVFAAVCLCGWLFVSTASAQSMGPQNGTLVIVGGGRM